MITPTPPQVSQDRSRIVFWLAVFFVAVSSISAVAVFLIPNNNDPNIPFVIGLLVLQTIICGLAALLASNDRHELAAWMLIATLILVPIPIQFIYSGLTISVGLLTLFEVIIVANLSLPTRKSLAAVFLGAVGFLAYLNIDQYVQPDRYTVPLGAINQFLPLMAIGIMISLVGFYIDKFVRNRSTLLKLLTLLGIFLFIVVVYSTYTTLVFDELRVTGPIYEEIIQQKDLLADISPSAGYIVESHLTVVQILEEAKSGALDEETLTAYTSRNRALRNNYESLMRNWLFTITEGELANQLNGLAYDNAIAYFQVRDEQFMPAIRENNIEEAERIYLEQLTPLFNDHKRAIERSVFIARQSSLQGEVQAIETAESFTLTRLFMLIGQIGIVLTVGLTIGRQITSAVLTLNQAAKAISAGNLNQQVEITSRDEFGQLAQTFNEMTDQLRGSVQELEARVEERTADLSTRTAELEALSARLERRANQLNAVANVARAATATPNLRDLLPGVANEISQEFGFYHTGIFLVDEDRKYAVLQAASSPGGKKMLLRGHRLQVGAEGMVGYVTSQGRVRLAFDVGDDAAFFNNPDLPETRSALTLPLKYGNDIIGALDVQSTVESAFSEEDIAVLSTLADQVSIAIHNAQLYDEAQRAIQQSEAAFRQYIRNEWGRYIGANRQPGYQFSDAEGTAPLMEASPTPETLTALETGQEQLQVDETQTRLAIPLKLRGETIGILNIQAPGSREMDADERDIIRAVSERVTLALENARLVEDSQRRASKEQLIGEITSRIGASINMRNVLQTAVEELGRALPGSEVVIQFSPEKRSKE